MNGWILAADELPNKPLPVLVWIENSGCGVGYFINQKILTGNTRRTWREVYQPQWLDLFGNVITEVVAWQAFPFGPNGEALLSGTLVALNRLED